MLNIFVFTKSSPAFFRCLLHSKMLLNPILGSMHTSPSHAYHVWVLSNPGLCTDIVIMYCALYVCRVPRGGNTPAFPK